MRNLRPALIISLALLFKLSFSQHYTALKHVNIFLPATNKTVYDATIIIRDSLIESYGLTSKTKIHLILQANG